MKLEPQHKHVIRLIARDRDAEGWAKVSNTLFPMLSANMPVELTKFEKLNDGGRARLTEEGEAVFSSMDWL